MYKSTGTLIYNPIRNNKSEKNPHWILLMVDDEITRYYRHVMKTRFFKELCVPSWGSHITVNPGRPIPKEKQCFWNKYEGKIFDFSYSNRIRSVDDDSHGGQFFFIDAFSDELNGVLSELGLLDSDKHHYHITIGRTYNNLNKINLP